MQYGHSVAVDLSVSADRKEVTCSVGGECGECKAKPCDALQGGNIILKAGGKLRCDTEVQ